MRKRYWIEGSRRDVLEIFDWAAHPEVRRRGAGLAVVQQAMREGVPLFTLGGSDDTLRILPRLGWRAVAEATAYTLPLRGAYVRRVLGSRAPVAAVLGGAGFDALGRAWFRARRPPARSAVRVEPVTGFGDLLDRQDAGRFHALVAAPDGAVLDWADRGLPRPGQYLRFEARRAGQPCGWALARVRVTEDGRAGEIVDFFGPPPALDVYDALVRQMTTCLAGMGADHVAASASCPIAQAALVRNRFLQRGRYPLLAFFPQGSPGPGATGPVHVMRGTADHCYLPLPPGI